MAFVKFTDTGKSFTPKASISPKGLVSFSHGARTRFMLDKYAGAVFYYDKEMNIVGMEFTNDIETDGFVKLRMRNIGADIAAKSFFTFFNLLKQTTYMYEIYNGDADNWLNIDLKKGRERKSGKKDGAEDETNENDFEDIA